MYGAGVESNLIWLWPYKRVSVLKLHTSYRFTILGLLTCYTHI
jgi:hypothetical protein